jgi:hypothetical protein
MKIACRGHKQREAFLFTLDPHFDTTPPLHFVSRAIEMRMCSAAQGVSP